MEKEEYLLVKNFGPLRKVKIELKPFMVFIGESGSGKSVILKLLSMCRYICKQTSLNKMAKELGEKDDVCLQVEELLGYSGLNDFLQNSTYIEYRTEFEHIEINVNKNKKAKLTVKNSKVILEKISLITDDRFTIAMMLNGQIRGSYDYHLQKTYEDFEEAFDFYDRYERRLTITTMDIELLRGRLGMKRRVFVKKESSKVQFHHASSGMKSVSVIETILFYFANMSRERYIKKQQTHALDFVFFNHYNDKSDDNLEEIFKKLNYFGIQYPDVFQSQSLRLNFFIEEPELSLFPTHQKKLIEFLSRVFNTTSNLYMAFSTHSPYMLSSLNCLLKAYAVSSQKSEYKKKIDKILPKDCWLSIEKFVAYCVSDGVVKNIIDQETGLILAEAIDGVSEEIGDIFDQLLDVEFEE